MKKLFFTCISFLLVLSLIPAAIGCQSVPKAAFKVSVASGQAPLTVVFTNMTEASSDNTTVFNWDFGDGATASTGMVGEQVTHEYTKVGTYTVTVTVSKKDNPSKTSVATANITVTHGPVASVNLTPAIIELNIGETQTFTIGISDSCDNPVPEASVSWESEAGTITDQGVFTSGTKAGTYVEGVTATAELDASSAVGTADITVVPDPLATATLSAFEITAGDTRQLKAIAKDQYGNKIEDLESTWSMGNEDAGSITAAGIYNASKKAANYTDAIIVEVKQGDKVCQAVGNVTVVPGALDQIVVAPEKIELGMGMTQQFVAAGADKFGNRISGLTFDWNVSGDAGTITNSGLFTAGNKPGTYNDNISVTATKDGVTQTVTPDVTVEPDRIIFLSNRKDETKAEYDLYIMDIDGSNVKKIITAEGTIRAGVACSPDGRMILFNDTISSGWSYTDYMYIANTDGSRKTLLLEGRKAHEPSWSPDGQKIAFQSWEHDPSEIYVMDVDGGNFQRLTNNQVYDDYPDWSPDGTKIVFISEMETAVVNPKIYIMNADGTQIRKITSGYTEDIFPLWSSDGKEILFQSNRFPATTWGIFIMNADGSDIRPVAASPDYNTSYPCWSPDGSKIVITYYKSEEGDTEIYLVNRDGSDLTRLTDNTAHDWSPEWLPRKQGVKVSGASIIIPEKFDTPELSTQEISAMASDAVVRIETELESGAESSGSGFVIESDGLILTNNHVIKDAKKITVYLNDGSSHDATVAAKDMIHDLAIIKIEATGLKTLSIGDLSGVDIGESVMVLGYPLGNENVSVTSGLISSIEYDDARNMTWVQTDSAVNWGNSGGPLMDMQGRVIGIVTAKYAGFGIEGMGLAIAANTINLYLEDLKAQL